MFVESYIQTATQIFNEYALQSPLSVFLKKYFKANSKFGSRDRKYIAELLYGIYRLGNKQHHLPLRDRMIIGSFLSSGLSPIFFQKTNSLLAENFHLSFAEKKKLVIEKYKVDFSIPFTLTENITEEEYTHYLFQPSVVFLRIRKNRHKIIETLQKKNILYETVSDNCISLPLNTKVQEILPDENEYVIQDIASQMAGAFFQPEKNESWWDCCAASGGKSLLLLDKNVEIDLTVSDIRQSIIQNLHDRFRLYGHKKYKALVLDVSQKTTMQKMFHNIIADVPCSGSGTWSRNPEQFYFFNEEKLNTFHSLQKSILNNVLAHLKPAGSLYYFTCSIFAKENEEVIHSIDKNEYSIAQQHWLKGFQHGGDCLYFCEIKKK